MAKRKNTGAATETKAAATEPAAVEITATDTLSAPEVPAVEAMAAPAEQPAIEALEIEAPKIEAAAIETATVEAPEIEAPKVEESAIEAAFGEAGKAEAAGIARGEVPDEIRLSAFDAPKIEIPASDLKDPIAPPDAEPASAPIFPMAAQADAARWRRNRTALIAASVAMAAALGGIAGAAATVGFSRQEPAANPVAAETRALKQTVAKLSGELHSLKAGFDTAGRHSKTQFNRIAERLERAERVQAEPAAKIARLAETPGRTERRPAAPVAGQLPPHGSDVTGSVTTVAKSQAKPPVLEGWRLRDFYAGRAILENRSNRTLYDIRQGSILPGIGKIEQIKRNHNHVTVVTPKGIITAELAPPPRRSPYYGPYR